MSFTNKTTWAEYMNSALNFAGFLNAITKIDTGPGTTVNGTTVYVPIISTLATQTPNGNALNATAKNNTSVNFTVAPTLINPNFTLGEYSSLTDNDIQRFVNEAATTMIRKIEQTVIASFGSFTQSFGTADTAITDTVLSQAMAYALAYGKGKPLMILGQKAYGEITKIAGFSPLSSINFDQSLTDTDFGGNRLVGRLGLFDVYLSDYPDSVGGTATGDDIINFIGRSDALGWLGLGGPKGSIRTGVIDPDITRGGVTIWLEAAFAGGLMVNASGAKLIN